MAPAPRSVCDVGVVCVAWALFAMLGEKGGVGEFGENFSVRAEPISEKKS